MGNRNDASVLSDLRQRKKTKHTIVLASNDRFHSGPKVLKYWQIGAKVL